MPTDITDYLSSLEQDPFWQATVTNEQGHLGVVMRGHPGAPYETGYYIEPERRYPYVLKGITDLFSSGKLTQMARAARALGRPRAAQTICEEVVKRADLVPACGL